MVLAFILLALGFVLVVKGADFLINGASSLAKRFQISELVIGLTVVAFGTSAPELVVNIFSSIGGKNELVLGNVIGSNIFNTFLILGIAALIYPLSVKRHAVRREIPFSMIVTLILFFMVNDHLLFNTEENQLSRIEALILLVFFAGFLYYSFLQSKQKTTAAEEIKLFSLPKTWIFILLGIGGLFFGGKLVVDNAVIIARKLHVSDKLIGLTIVSMGTSLPELATSAVAAYKKRCDLAVGNVVGSNIFNFLLILGTSGSISPILYDPVFNFDMAVFGLGTLVLFAAMFTLKRRKLDRFEAFILLVIYVSYMVYIILRK